MPEGVVINANVCMTDPNHDSDRLKYEPNIHELRRAVADFNNDPQSAIPQLESLAERGSTVSMEYLGEAYAQRLPALNWGAAEYWYTKADELGSARAAFGLAIIVGKKGNAKGSFEAYQRSHDRGYLPATFRLGEAYATGNGVAKDLQKARDHWEQAAKRGHVPAKAHLSGLYFSGAFGSAARLRGLRWVGSLLRDFFVFQILGSFPGGPTLDEERMN